jgi:hypothetical protein
LDWRAKVELYEQIRREYEFGVGSVIGVARKLGVHRRMVREAVRNAVPAQRKKTERPAVKMAPAVSLAESILESDRKASIWSIIWKCWNGSLERCVDRRRWRSGEPRAGGLRVTTEVGQAKLPNSAERPEEESQGTAV